MNQPVPPSRKRQVAEPWREAVAAYHDGEADAALRAKVEALLASSAEARAYLAELRTMDAALARYAGTLAEPSAQLLEATRSRMLATQSSATASKQQRQDRGSESAPATSSPRQLLLRRIAPVGVAAAAAVLLVVGLALLWGAPEDEPRPLPSSVAGTDDKPDGEHDERPGTEEREAPEELLELLDLLASDLDFETLAALEPEELEWLTDVVYHDALSALDDEGWEE